MAERSMELIQASICGDAKKVMDLLRQGKRYESGKNLPEMLFFVFLRTLNLHSKGPSRKRNPPLRDIIFCPIISILIYFYIGFKGFSVYGKN